METIEVIINPDSLLKPYLEYSFLNLQLTKYPNLNVKYSGNLGTDIFNFKPDTALFIFIEKDFVKHFTLFTSNYRKHPIVLFVKENNIRLLIEIKSLLKPVGIIHINDLSLDNFSQMILIALKRPPFHSALILKQLKLGTQVSDLDYQILDYLKMGKEIKNMHEHLPASASTLLRRKKKLKKTLSVWDKNDTSLICAAIQNGLIDL